MAALGRNITASAASQIVTIVVMLVATPVLLQVLGTEAYGLIAFFLTLQASMVLLDLGLTATLMKKTVEQRSGTVAADAYLALSVSVRSALVLAAMHALCRRLMWNGWR